MPFSITVGHAQTDERKFVLEVHSDAQSEFARVEYLADPLADFNAIATARNAQLLLSAADEEVQTAIVNDSPATLRFQTIDEFLVRVRTLFGNSQSGETCRISKWIIRRLQDASITEAQLRTAFVLNAARWNTLKTKMQIFFDSFDAVETARGE